MASVIGDSAGARRMGRALRNGSSEIDRIEGKFRRAVDASECRGAFGFAERTFRSFQSQRTNGVEFRMNDLATAVERHATWVDDTERELHDLERRIRRWAAAHPPSDDPTHVGPDASLIRYWPASLSFEWRDLAARLRAHGAWF